MYNYLVFLRAGNVLQRQADRHTDDLDDRFTLWVGEEKAAELRSEAVEGYSRDVVPDEQPEAPDHPHDHDHAGSGVRNAKGSQVWI